MTNPAILEALTAKMEEIWNDDLSFADQAAAVLELVGPEKLVWNGFVSGHYEITVQAGGRADLRHHTTPTDDEEPEYIKGGYLTLVSLDDLKAAAQSHATAAHWLATPLGKLVGVV